MTDDRVQTIVYTPSGKMGFHQFWVARRARDRVVGVKFRGIERAAPAPGVIKALRRSKAIIIGPSNPVTSIGPILRIRNIGKTLAKRRKKVFVVSPIIGEAPVSGPAGVLMRGLGYEVSPVGVAEIYRDFIGTLLIHRDDWSWAKRVEKTGIRVERADLLMSDIAAKVRLGRKIIELAGR